MKYTLCLLIPLLLGASSSRYSLSPEDILQRSERQLIYDEAEAELKVELIRPDWTKSYRLKTWSKGQEKAMVYVMEPEKDKGTVLLKKGDVVYNYIPKIKKVIKVPSHIMSQRWMGSDLSIEDLLRGKRLSVDYTASIVGEASILGRSCHKLELSPKAGSAVLWSKIEMWVDKADFLQLRSIYYDEDGDQTHRMYARSVKRFGKANVVNVMEVIPSENEAQKTRLEYLDLQLNTGISDDFFTVAKMKQLSL